MVYIYRGYDMTIYLYNNYSNQNVVNKKKTLLTTLVGDLKENVNMESIVVTIPYFPNYAQLNYCYIPEFARYYFCEVEVMNGRRLKISGTSDPLSSFWGTVKTSPCIAKRSATVVNKDIVDKTFVWSPQPKIIHRKMGTAFTPSSSGDCYVLTLGGK